MRKVCDIKIEILRSTTKKKKGMVFLSSHVASTKLWPTYIYIYIYTT